jgi:hypothetical protein
MTLYQFFFFAFSPNDFCDFFTSAFMSSVDLLIISPDVLASEEVDAVAAAADAADKRESLCDDNEIKRIF